MELNLTCFLLFSLLSSIYGLPACDSQIWCDGPLLHALQTAGLFNDSKTFVDMSLKSGADEVLSEFSNLTQNGSVPATVEQLQTFLDTYFNKVDSELKPWIPSDYIESPPFLERIKDEEFRKFGKELCRTWKNLGRTIKTDVKVRPDRYSLIYLDNPFIVPGGRFREVYYWDSYWVIKGLLVCQYNMTVKGMLENMLSLVRRYNMVPNGGRVYYTRRSQPPMLIPMVDAYVKATNDVTFLRDHMELLEKEYHFWQTNRVVELNDGVVLNRYDAPITQPRPESYAEDLNTLFWNTTTKSKEDLYADLASAAESGWDFSSRWFSRGYNEHPDKDKWLGYINTRDVVPVDLNSILCWNENTMARFYERLGNTSRKHYFDEQHAHRTVKMADMLWDKEAGIWLDYRISARGRHDEFYPSNVFPLFTKCYAKDKQREIENSVLRYLRAYQVLSYRGGIPTSLTPTRQQWDFPAAWPPLQHVIITALADSSVEEGRKLGQQLAQNWIYSNYLGWNRTHNMFEKYDAEKPGSRGGGGEYDVQEGFGWTNGVVLELLDRFGQVMHRPHKPTNASPKGHNSCYTVFAVLLTSIVLIVL